MRAAHLCEINSVTDQPNLDRHPVEVYDEVMASSKANATNEAPPLPGNDDGLFD